MNGRHAAAEQSAVIALGSNLPMDAEGIHHGRESLLRDAVRAIDALDGVRVTAASGIVETPALKLHGVDEDAPSYLNAVVLADTTLDPEDLLQQLHGIEASLGRVREEVWGDRTIDLDLIDVGGITRHNDTITLPHPRAWQRAFVLEPWSQVQPDAVLPGHGPIAALLAATTDRVTTYPAEPLIDAGPPLSAEQ
ncbi:2-amino-4-hydroxy-6-hydroxymethyldihydropteridine diphosphokinase [Cryobacterium mesophilum]|uniref:2-amino-4-hydroxy-6- hydroxymethyldihydropteridine diphosphokinase n=1 Tax=Terrimesophilobacter mesophilus TaxID=433647 RepID=UPI0017C2B2FB|nr:2-amino-4-hydroxy-6-hydroxymethyldihydropteridine diphosphokinase [Terrimesophilobacter mesophilus]MBB5633317.1 2-amino-4-hydroxy-6-hydroxymethyldihydropteridine diphosphokinase [Terrimesophilobacter mesophilus]